MEVNKKLKIAYSILKEFSEGNKKINQETYGIEYHEFLDILKFIQDEGFIRNVTFANKNNRPAIGWWENAEITMKGINYLQENSKLSKGYKTIKEIRDWLPL